MFTETLQIMTLALLGVFYVAYAVKALMLKRRGIAVNLLGKGDKPKEALTIERSLRFVTPAVAIVQFISVIFPDIIWSLPSITYVSVAGIVLLLLGNLFFISAMLTMRDNWRAGFSRDQKTDLVTRGVYSLSRNPAFVGFDLIYIGCAVAFPNVVNIAVAIVAVTLFHFQILGEEKYCAEAFGQEYTDYRKRTMRYIGKRRI